MANYPYQPMTYPYQQMYQQPQQIQNGGIVKVPSEEVARNYPVALGNSVTFIDENGRFCYTKTMGFSPLDAPRFDRYRLVKEAAPDPVPEKAPAAEYALRKDLEDLREELKKLKEAALRKEKEDEE